MQHSRVRWSGLTLTGSRGAENTYQLVVPGDVIDDLLANIFPIKNVLDAVILLVGVATALALIQMFSLLLRLRQREIRTVFR